MKTLKQAFEVIKSELPDDPSVVRRLERAYDIVRAQGSGYDIIKHRVSGGYAYRVVKASTTLLEDNSVTYDTGKSCTCPDYANARAGLCKHRLAVQLLEEMER